MPDPLGLAFLGAVILFALCVSGLVAWDTIGCYARGPDRWRRWRTRHRHTWSLEAGEWHGDFHPNTFSVCVGDRKDVYHPGCKERSYRGVDV